VLDELPLSAGTRAALLGGETRGRYILDAVRSYERGDWDSAAQAAARVGIGRDRLPEAYTHAVHWTWALAQGEAA
jgi:c-di-GMP-related signal transduction protein